MALPSTATRSGRPPNTPMRLYTGAFEGHDIAILIGREGRPCVFHARHTGLDVVRRADRYPNARALSADLRGTLGFGPSLAVLQAMGVPTASDLYDLNQDGEAARTLIARGPIAG